MKIVLYILIGIVAVGGIGLFFGLMGQGYIKRMVINEVDLSKVADGVYTGGFRKMRWNYTVEVTVKDHLITAVKTIAQSPNPTNAKVTKDVGNSIIER